LLSRRKLTAAARLRNRSHFSSDRRRGRTLRLLLRPRDHDACELPLRQLFDAGRCAPPSSALHCLLSSGRYFWVPICFRVEFILLRSHYVHEPLHQGRYMLGPLVKPCKCCTGVWAIYETERPGARISDTAGLAAVAARVRPAAAAVSSPVALLDRSVASQPPAGRLPRCWLSIAHVSCFLQSRIHRGPSA